MELPCISHPLINQDKARSVFLEKFAQGVARARGFLVVSANALKSLLPAKLPGEFTPKGAYDCAVRLLRGIARGNTVADQYDRLENRQLLNSRFLQDGIYAGQFARGRAREKV